MWAAGRVLDGFIARRNGTNKLQAFARGVARLHGNSDVSYGDVDRCAPTQGGKCANHDIGGNQRRAQMINRRVIPRRATSIPRAGRQPIRQARCHYTLPPSDGLNTRPMVVLQQTVLSYCL